MTVDQSTGEIIDASAYDRTQREIASGKSNQRDVEAYWCHAADVLGAYPDQDLQELLASACEGIKDEGLRAMTAKKNPRMSKLAQSVIMNYLGVAK